MTNPSFNVVIGGEAGPDLVRMGYFIVGVDQEKVLNVLQSYA